MTTHMKEASNGEKGLLCICAMAVAVVLGAVPTAWIHPSREIGRRDKGHRAYVQTTRLRRLPAPRRLRGLARQ